MTKKIFYTILIALLILFIVTLTFMENNQSETNQSCEIKDNKYEIIYSIDDKNFTIVTRNFNEMVFNEICECVRCFDKTIENANVTEGFEHCSATRVMAYVDCIEWKCKDSQAKIRQVEGIENENIQKDISQIGLLI